MRPRRYHRIAVNLFQASIHLAHDHLVRATVLRAARKSEIEAAQCERERAAQDARVSRVVARRGVIFAWIALPRRGVMWRVVLWRGVG